MKKNIGQKKFTANWAPYMKRAKGFRLSSELKIKYDDIPISVKSIAQTIGKRNPGGERAGLAIVSYLSIEFIVTKADNPPIPSAIPMLISSCFQLILCTVEIIITS